VNIRFYIPSCCRAGSQILTLGIIQVLNKTSGMFILLLYLDFKFTDNFKVNNESVFQMYLSTCYTTHCIQFLHILEMDLQKFNFMSQMAPYKRNWIKQGCPSYILTFSFTNDQAMIENGNMLQQIILSPNISFPDYKTHLFPLYNVAYNSTVLRSEGILNACCHMLHHTWYT